MGNNYSEDFALVMISIHKQIDFIQTTFVIKLLYIDIATENGQPWVKCHISQINPLAETPWIGFIVKAVLYKLVAFTYLFYRDRFTAISETLHYVIPR